MTLTSTSTTRAFFYGTLMHPGVLRKVIQRNTPGPELVVCPAILPGYIRHRVRHETYPGIVEYEKSLQHHGRDGESQIQVAEEDRNVLGVVVDGLTESDMRYLDRFEGDEYFTQTVTVQPLKPFSPLDSALNPWFFESINSGTEPERLETINVSAYIYASPSELEPSIWSYDTFLKEHLHIWYTETVIRGLAPMGVQSGSREGY